MGPAETPVQHTAGRVSHRCCIGQNLLHPVVRVEFLALDDTDGCQLACKFRIVGIGRLGLNIGVDHLEERIVAWGDRIERLAARLEELGFRNRRIHFKPYFAFERRCDARADTARRVGIDLHILLDVLDGRLRIVVYKVTARCIDDPVRLRPRNIETTFRNRTVITGWQQQVSSAFAAVGTGEPDIDDPAKPHVVDRAYPHRRLLDHGRPLRQIHDAEIVDGIGIGREEQRLRIHQFRAKGDRVVLCADAEKTLADRIGRCAAIAVEERVKGASEIKRVINLVDGVCTRRAILEIERTDARLYFIRGNQNRWDFGRRLAKSWISAVDDGCGDKSCK
ncbi:hypothetical protein D9M68_424570 [compost metagenome]